MPTESISIVTEAGHTLTGSLELPTGLVRGAALFAHLTERLQFSRADAARSAAEGQQLLDAARQLGEGATASSTAQQIGQFMMSSSRSFRMSPSASSVPAGRPLPSPAY